MAEIFGIATGALSVAALFNNCVDTFGYIQLARHFGEDYQRCQLKLDVAQTRLGRWGEAVGINKDPRFASDSPTDEAVQNAQDILDELARCFVGAYEKSQRYAKRNKDDKNLQVYSEDEMSNVPRALHGRFRNIVSRRQKSISLAKKTAWALYDGKSLEGIINNISSWIDDLEKLFPVEAVRQKFGEIEIEIEEVRDGPSLKMLQDVAQGIDQALVNVVEKKVKAIEGSNGVGEANLDDGARMQVGHTYSDAVAQHGTNIQDNTKNYAGRVGATKGARVQIGNSYGGKGIWDDGPTNSGPPTSQTNFNGPITATNLVAGQNHNGSSTTTYNFGR